MHKVPGTCCALALLLAGPAAGSAQRGDLCFPLEGWAIVARWHVGSAARSVREGWIRRFYDDRGWVRVAAGKPLPAAASGSWLRSTFTYRRSVWSHADIVPGGWPAGARLLLNGAFADPTDMAAQLRQGMNSIVVALPPEAVTVPVLEVRGVSRTSGKEKTIVRLGVWRFRAEETASALSSAWIRGTGPGDTPQPTTTMPTAADAALPRAPVGIRATLDVPAYWRKRPVSLYLHAIPGTPSVFINGDMVAESLRCPARLELGTRFKFDGRDTVAIVWPEPPPPSSAAPLSGHTELENRPVEGWGVAALHWSSGVPLPVASPGSVLAWDPTVGGGQPGARQALAYAAEILAVSATAYTLGWTETPIGPMEPAGIMVAAWSGTTFRGVDLTATREAAATRLMIANGNSGRPVWLLTPPTVGRDRKSGANSRLLEQDRSLIALAHSAGARPVPIFAVFNSALRRQRLWPVRPEWSDTRGILTPGGAYLAALVILDTLSLR